MKKINYNNPFVLLGKAIKAVRHEMWLSFQILFCITAVLAIVFWHFEHQAQPEVFSRFWQSVAWTMTRYMDNADAIMDKAPITVAGKITAALMGFVAIALVAIPAGLVGSGFMDAIVEEKREKEILRIKERLTMAFAKKQCRHTKFRTVPHYVSMVDIQAKQSIDSRDVIAAVNDDTSFRLRNLATTQPLSEHAHDRLVVEHFPVNTSYGCKIDRKSNVTIVSTSSCSECGIGNFAYYLALFGGFNYVSKEMEVNPDEPFSYYNIVNEDGDANIKDFLNDIRSMQRSDSNWVVFLLSASGAEEPEYPTAVHWIHGARRGDSSYSDPNITIKNSLVYDAMYKDASSLLYDEYGYDSDQQAYHAGSSKMYIGRHIQCEGIELNAFTLRMDFKLTVWDDRRIKIIYDIANVMSKHLCGKALEESQEWKNKSVGYNYQEGKQC